MKKVRKARSIRAASNYGTQNYADYSPTNAPPNWPSPYLCLHRLFRIRAFDGRHLVLSARSSQFVFDVVRTPWQRVQTNIDASINPRMTLHNDGFLYFTINLTKMSRTVDRSVMDLGCSDSKRGGGGNGYVTSIVSSTRRNVVYLSCASNHRVIEASWNDKGELVKMRLLPNHGGDLQIFPLSNGNEYLTVFF